MFGYIRPATGELRVRDDTHYRAAYCGLCRALGKRYGMSCRFLVNYDITFLYLLLAALEEPPKCERCFCPAHPLRRCRCTPRGRELDYCADVCVLLCAYALADTRRDGKGMKKLGASLACLALRRPVRQASSRLPALSAQVRHQMDELHRLEQSKCASMDRAADTFAELLRHCADELLPDEKRPQQQLLYHVGRFIYLTDALDDLAGDAQDGSYNPLLYRFDCPDGALSPDDRAYICRSIGESIAHASAALALCELKSNSELLENIVSLGMPAILCAVERGVFRSKRKMKATGEL